MKVAQLSQAQRTSGFLISNENVFLMYFLVWKNNSESFFFSKKILFDFFFLDKYSNTFEHFEIVNRERKLSQDKCLVTS